MGGQDTKNRLNPLGRLTGASQEHLRNTSGAPQESCDFGFRGQSVYAACTSYGFGHACVEIHRELHFLHFGCRGCVVETIYNVTCDIMAGGRMIANVRNS